MRQLSQTDPDAAAQPATAQSARPCRVSRLASRDCSNIKNALRSLIGGFIGSDMNAELGDDEDEEDEVYVGLPSQGEWSLRELIFAPGTARRAGHSEERDARARGHAEPASMVRESLRQARYVALSAAAEASLFSPSPFLVYRLGFCANFGGLDRGPRGNGRQSPHPDDRYPVVSWVVVVRHNSSLTAPPVISRHTDSLPLALLVGIATTADALWTLLGRQTANKLDAASFFVDPGVGAFNALLRGVRRRRSSPGSTTSRADDPEYSCSSTGKLRSPSLLGFTTAFGGPSKTCTTPSMPLYRSSK